MRATVQAKTREGCHDILKSETKDSGSKSMVYLEFTLNLDPHVVSPIKVEKKGLESALQAHFGLGQLAGQQGSNEAERC